jgi:hypothetical protein
MSISMPLGGVVSPLREIEQNKLWKVGTVIQKKKGKEETNQKVDNGTHQVEVRVYDENTEGHRIPIAWWRSSYDMTPGGSKHQEGLIPLHSGLL